MASHGIRDKVAIVGMGCTAFREHWDLSTDDLLIQSSSEALASAGVTLPDVAGMSPKEIRDLYSAQYPELISAEIETGEVEDGVQEITFKRAVGTKG